MRRGDGRIPAWILLLVWATWGTAFGGWLAGEGRLARWAPDLSVALFASLAGFLTARDVPRLALVAALARGSLSGEVPLALLAGFLALASAANLVRHFVDLRGPFARAGLAAAAAPALAAWSELVRAARAGDGFGLAGGELAALAFVSALVTLVGGDLLARLPGLSPLRRRPW